MTDNTLDLATLCPICERRVFTTDEDDAPLSLECGVAWGKSLTDADHQNAEWWCWRLMEVEDCRLLGYKREKARADQAEADLVTLRGQVADVVEKILASATCGLTLVSSSLYLFRKESPAVAAARILIELTGPRRPSRGRLSRTRGRET